MKNLKDIINEKLIINKNTKLRTYNYHPEDKDELKELIEQLIDERGENADLNDIDISEITDMSGVFDSSKFDGDISNWNVSNVENMNYMFYNSDFTGENGDISKWNVSKVENMKYMFYRSKFTGKNGDISKWDVSNVTNMQYMFKNSPLEKNPPKWYKK